MFRTLLNPMSELQQMIDSMDRAFNAVRSEARPAWPSEMILPVDIWQKENSVFIRAAVPGVSQEDLDIQVSEHILTISGETKLDVTHDEKVNFWRREYAVGKFRRSIRLPDFAIAENIEATFENGFVTILVPLAIQSPKVVQVPVRRSIESGHGVLEQKTTSEDSTKSLTQSKN